MTTTRLITTEASTRRRPRRTPDADAPPPSIAPTPVTRAFGIIVLVVATLYFLVPVY
jgi:multiple sugar transport system permease protein